MKTVKLLQYEDLTKEEQEDQPENGSGKEYASYIVVEENGKKRIYSDAMEPEDTTFGRDLNWIIAEICVNNFDALLEAAKMLMENLAIAKDIDGFHPSGLDELLQAIKNAEAL